MLLEAGWSEWPAHANGYRITWLSFTPKPHKMGEEHKRKIETGVKKVENKTSTQRSNNGLLTACSKCPEQSVRHRFGKFSSVAQMCPTLCDPMNRSTPGLPVHHQLQSSLRLRSIESVMPSNHLTLCRPLLLPSIFPSIRAFSNESTLHLRWPKFWSLSFSIIPSKEHPGLISFRMDWLDMEQQASSK